MKTHPHPLPPGDTTLSLLTLNVWGLRLGPWSIARDIDDRIRLISRHLSDCLPDVVVMQEVWCERIARHFVTTLRYPYYSYHPCRRAIKGHLGNGLLMMSRKPILEEGVQSFSAFTRPDEYFANKGFQWIQVESGAGQVLIVHTHLGAGRKPIHLLRRLHQMEEMLSWIRTTPLPLVLAGDFNMGENSPEYMFMRNWLSQQYDESEDTYRRHNPGKAGHTFFVDRSYANPSAHCRNDRIDYIFAAGSKRHRSNLRSLDSRIVLDFPEEHLSDHVGVLTTVAVTRKTTIDALFPSPAEPAGLPQL